MIPLNNRNGVDNRRAMTSQRRGRRHGKDYGIMWILELLSLLFLRARFSPIIHDLDVLFQGKINK